MKTRQQKIALIVPKPFGYSETFFNYDYQVWKKLGFKVEVLPIQNAPEKQGFLKVEYSKPPRPISESPFFSVLQVGLTLVKYIKPHSFLQLVRFAWLEKKENVPFRSIVRKTYDNYHILNSKNIDHLFFGYGNLAVGRENLANALNARMYLFFRGSDLAVYPLLAGKNIYQKTFKKSDKVAFRNENLKTLARYYSFNPKTPHQLIFNRIDCQKLKPKLCPGALQNPIRIISVSRLHWLKGLPYLILALKQLKNNGLSIQTKIVGEGDDFEYLFYLVKTLGLEGQIEFKGGMTENLVKKEMQKSDVLVHPTLFESNARVLLEAQAIGLLTISSNWEGVNTIIKDEKTGWLFQKRNPEDLARKIQYISSLPQDYRKEVSQNAIKHIQHNFNLKDSYKEFENLLRS